jgi:hypothetical protein
MQYTEKVAVPEGSPCFKRLLGGMFLYLQDLPYEPATLLYRPYNRDAFYPLQVNRIDIEHVLVHDIEVEEPYHAVPWRLSRVGAALIQRTATETVRYDHVAAPATIERFREPTLDLRFKTEDGRWLHVVVHKNTPTVLLGRAGHMSPLTYKTASWSLDGEVDARMEDGRELVVSADPDVSPTWAGRLLTRLPRGDLRLDDDGSSARGHRSPRKLSPNEAADMLRAYRRRPIPQGFEFLDGVDRKAVVQRAPVPYVHIELEDGPCVVPLPDAGAVERFGRVGRRMWSWRS